MEMYGPTASLECDRLSNANLLYINSYTTSYVCIQQWLLCYTGGAANECVLVIRAFRTPGNAETQQSRTGSRQRWQPAVL